MCGILIKEGNPLTTDELINIFDEDIEGFGQRGSHSFGLLCVNTETGDSGTIKFCTNDNEKDLLNLLAINDINYDEINEKYNVFIYHNRWASVGGKTVELAHPIEEDDWIVVHNGTKHGADLLDSLSDTQGFARYILSSPKIRTGFLRGSGVLIAWDSKEGKLYFHKDGSRSLWYNEENKVLSSEPLKIMKGNWVMVSDADFIPYEDKGYYTNEMVEYISKLDKQSTKGVPDCCKRKSSNSVKIGTVDICYNCISEYYGDLEALKKSKTITRMVIPVMEGDEKC